MTRAMLKTVAIVVVALAPLIGAGIAEAHAGGFGAAGFHAGGFHGGAFHDRDFFATGAFAATGFDSVDFSEAFIRATMEVITPAITDTALAT